MNLKSLYILQASIAVASIIMWFVGRPGKCANCGARLAVKHGFCQKCGKAADGRIGTSSNRSVNLEESNQTAGRKPIFYFLAVLVLIPGISALPLDSGTQLLLGLSVTIGGLVWVLLALKRAAACWACNELTYGKFCSHCGSERTNAHG